MPAVPRAGDFPPRGLPSDRPQEIPEGQVLVVFRVVKVGDHAAGDYPDSFRSHAELGLPPRGPALEHPQIYEGISVYDRIEAAIETARRWPRIGDFVARLEIAGGTDVRVLAWGQRGHLTLWGDPLMLSATTTEISLVQAH